MRLLVSTLECQLSATDDTAWPEHAVEVGRILDAWGVKGWIKVQPFSNDPEALLSARRWFVQPPEATGLSATAISPVRYPSLLRVVSAKEHGDGIVAQVQDVLDRSSAESLRGGRLFLPRSSFPTPEPDEFYWIDLIGLDVVNRSGEPLGRVKGLLETGAHSVLQIEQEGQPERLVPFVAAYVDEVSLADRQIKVDWGLDY